jgi:hypothetical protein
MKKVLVLAILLVFFASFAEATLPVMEKYRVNLTELMAVAKTTLSEDGFEKLRQIFANAKAAGEEEVNVGSAFFFVPALRPDLERNDLARINKFLKLISDRELVSARVTGGGREFKSRGLFRVVYSLEERPLAMADEKAGGKSGKRYGLKAQKIRPGNTRVTGILLYQILMDK